jgi:hypothetical protein
MLSKAKSRARRHGVPFALDVTHIKIPLVCPVLGIVLVRGRGKCGSPNSPSLDRIVPELGYVPGNVIVVSWEANRIKNKYGPLELLRVAKYYLSIEPYKSLYAEEVAELEGEYAY